MCQHHWMIKEADGPTSKGLCRKCRKEGEFPNYIQIGRSEYMTMLRNSTRNNIPGIKKSRMVVPSKC